MLQGWSVAEDAQRMAGIAGGTGGSGTTDVTLGVTASESIALMDALDFTRDGTAKKAKTSVIADAGKEQALNAAGGYIELLRMSNNLAFMAFPSGSSICCKVITLNDDGTFTQGPTLTVSTPNIAVNPYRTYFCVENIGNNRFLIGYVTTGSNQPLNWVIVKVTGTTVTLEGTGNIPVATHGVPIGSRFLALGTDLVLWVYGDLNSGSYLNAAFLTINGATVNTTAKTVLHAADCRGGVVNLIRPNVAANPNKICAVYCRYNSSQLMGLCFEVNASAKTFTRMGTTYALWANYNGANLASAELLAPDSIALAYDSPEGYDAKYAILTINDLAIQSFNFDGDRSMNVHYGYTIIPITASSFLALYALNQSNANSNIFTQTVRNKGNSWVLNANVAQDTTSAYSKNFSSFVGVMMDSVNGRVLVAFNDPHNGDTPYIRQLWLDDVTSNAGKSKTMKPLPKAIAKSAAVSGSIVTGQFAGLLSGVSGLTPGINYYWDVDNGLLTTSVTSHSVGFAISATEIVLKLTLYANDVKPAGKTIRTYTGNMTVGKPVYVKADGTCADFTGTGVPIGICIGSNAVLLRGVADVFNGLIPGAKYFIDPFGQLNTRADVANRYLGVAISSTKMLIPSFIV